MTPNRQPRLSVHSRPPMSTWSTTTARVATLTATLLLFTIPPALAADPLAVLDDEFTSAATLVNWDRVFQTEQWNADQLEHIDINTSRPGWITMMPYTSTWYQNWRGELAYKEVTGDFAVTTRLHVTNRAGTAAPNRSFSLAGILLRTPRNITPATWTPGGENYTFLSLGAANAPGTYQFEVKTTVNSLSNLEISSAGTSEVLIQLARIGPHIIALYQIEPGPWVVHRRYNRADFPATLQVGMTVYTDWDNVAPTDPFLHNGSTITTGTPDLIAEYDYFRFRTPNVPVPLQGADLSNTSSVSDAQLLSFLGTNALPVTLSRFRLD
jgi:hypothetical protein